MLLPAWGALLAEFAASYDSKYVFSHGKSGDFLSRYVVGSALVNPDAQKGNGAGLAEGEEMRKRPAPVSLPYCYRGILQPRSTMSTPVKKFFADAGKASCNIADAC